MKSISKDIRGFVIFLVVVSMLGLWSLSARSDVTGRPHDLSLDNQQGHCINCHDLHQTGLGAGFAHNLKRANEIAVCYQCHAGAESNYTSIDPSFPNWTVLISSYNIKAEFEQPNIHFALYGMDGEHNKCSHCHNPHGVFDSTSTTRRPKLLSAGPDVVTDTDDYCLVCHNSDPSPPHQPFANISVGDQYRFSRDIYKAMTHSTFVRSTTTTEPVPDTARTYDDNPYAPGRDISCLTCHRPHGSPNDHMLKGPDDQTFCLDCHDGDPAPDLTSFTASGHGKAGVDRICQECHFPHGTGQENAVKTKITDPHSGTEKTADVSGQGMDEACFACHDAAETTVRSDSFTSSISLWYQTGLTISLEPTLGNQAPGSLKAVNTSAGDHYTNTSYLDVSPGTQYVVSAYLYLPQDIAPTGAFLKVVEFDSSYVVVANTSTPDITHTGDRWQYIGMVLTTSPTTTRIRVRANMNNAGTAYWDDVLVLKSAYDGGYFRGRSDYEASIHNTSPNAHNPSDASGDFQPGECDNCHNPHGKGVDKMLLKADENVCYDCHNATTPNTLSGDDVQAAFQSAYGHDLAQVGCADCHNVHTVTQASLLMDPHNPEMNIPNSTLFCLGCHGGAVPAGVGAAPDVSSDWSGSGHNATQAIGCSDCHEPHGSPNAGSLNYRPEVYGGYTAAFAPGNDFTTRAFCESCHNRTGSGYKGAPVIPTGTGYVSQHGSGDSTACSNCHVRAHDPTLANYTGGSSYYTIACLECHTQGAGNPFPEPDAQFNTPTNGTDADTMRSTHALTYDPYSSAVVDCTACHGSDHEADHNDTNRVFDPDTSLPAAGGLDISTSNGFCFRCHDYSPVSIGGMTPRDILDTYTAAGHGIQSADVLCSECHVYHGSTSERLLRQTVNGLPVLTDYSGNNASVCTACHRGTDAALPLWPGYEVYSSSIHAFGNPTTGNYATDRRHGPGACVNCHDPHARRVDGETTHNMLKADGETLCYSCHATSFDNFSTPGGHGAGWIKYSGSQLDVTRTGGQLKYGRTQVDAGENVEDGLERVNAFPDKDCTISVKLRVDEITRTDGGARFGLWIYDQYDSTNYVLAFFRANTSPRVWMARYTDDGGQLGNVDEFGDESVSFHTLKLVRRKAAGEVDAYIDDTLMRTCQFDTNGSFVVRLYCNITGTADGSPEYVELTWDDFDVSFDDNDLILYNTASRDDVMTRFDLKNRHDISDQDQLGEDGLPGTADDSKVECTDCHDPHTITASLMAYENISGAITPVEADQNFCLKCHDGDPPAGVLFPEEGVWDKSDYTLSAHGNDMKRYKAFGNYSSGVTYACKVCHNPHGSNQAGLQRETWDINRDGLPDDIDGDGVLDSTNMVGYIGYSTGSRKAMLVDYPRAGFARVSSTMPYQDNGTIDVELCLNCHDGTPAPDVETDFNKLSHHDVTFADQTASGGSKIECYHCHDQHRAQARDDQAGEYPTTNPDPPREPMPGDAQFCLKCHDNTLPEGLSFGSEQLKNVKLSYNPGGHLDGNGYDIITSFIGHYDQDTGVAMMCRECHNQHGSSFRKLLRDDTNPAGAYYDPAQPVQGMHTIVLRPSDAYSGGDSEPQSSTAERCLGCHSGETTFNGKLIPLPPPPDSDTRGFSMPPVGKHPDLNASVTFDNETGEHIYYPSFAVVTSPGSVKDPCTLCHDSHSPYIATVNEQLMDCYQCHNENTSLPDVQSEFNDNPTNPTRSKSIHSIKYDPTGTDSSYVECLKCHDQSRHMLGVVRLRKDPTAFNNYTTDGDVWADPVASGTINTFCLECHDSSSGVAESFWRGGVEHVPPKLPAGHLSGAHFTDGGLLCTDCHEYHGSVNTGMRKNAYGEEETFCFACHDNPANSQNGVNISAKFALGNTHDIDDSDQAANGTAVECEDCHNPHVVTRTNPVVSVDDKTTPVASNSAFCEGCHDTDGGAGVRFAGYTTGASGPEWNPSDGSWNRWNKAAFAGSSHELGGIECKDCHDPHGSPNYSLLLENISSATGVSVGFGLHSTARGMRTEELGVNSVCASCHQGTMGVYAGYSSFTSLTFGHKNGIDKNCTYCHNPHGTSEAKLIRSDKPLNMDMGSPDFGSIYNFKGFGNQTTGAPYYVFCSSRGCHSTERPAGTDTFDMDRPVDNFTGGETRSSHHPIKEGVLECKSCHVEHGSVNDPSLRAPYFRGDNWPPLFKSGVGVYDNYRNPGYGSQFLGSDVNYFEKARSGLPDNTNRNKVTTVNPPDDANDLCFMCHQKDDIIGDTTDGMANTNTHFLGHEAIEGGATITQNISRTGNGVGSDYHNFSCSACHLPHSIGRAKLVKQGCFSQSDGQAPNYSYAPTFYCHGYNGWSNWNYGWRNLTSLDKTDFKRPANAVDDLSFTLEGDLTLHLNWHAVEDEPGAGADHYNVYRSDTFIVQETKPYATRIMSGVSGVAIGSPQSWTDYTCQPNTTYFYVVVACDADNNESFVSNCVAVSVGADITSPAEVTDQQVWQLGGTYSVGLTWSDPGDNVNVSEYRIYRLNAYTTLVGSDIVPGNYLMTVNDTVPTADGSPDAMVYNATDNSTLFGQDYSYAVVAADAANNVSAVPTGSTYSVTIVDPEPAAVDDLSVRPLPGVMEAELSWSAPANIGAISGYNVYRQQGAALTQSDLVPGNMIAGPVPGLTYVDTAVPATATDYYYAVTALDDSSGKESLLGNSVPVNLPGPPTGLVAGRNLNSVAELGWSQPAYISGLTGYKFYSRRDSGSWIYEGTVSGLTNVKGTVDLYGREPGTYDFAVSSVYNTYGGTTPYESVKSVYDTLVVSDTVKPFTASAIAYLTPASDYTEVRVDWDAPADDNYTGVTPLGVDHYRITASYNHGASWGALISTRISNSGFEVLATGNVDDTNTDTFTGWTISSTYAYAVSDSFLDSKAVRIVYSGSGDRYILSTEPDTGQSLANKTYSLSFWAKADKDTTFQYFIQASGGGYEQIGVTSPSIGTSWQRFTASGTFSAGETATKARVIIRPSSDTSAGITVDGVRLESGTSALAATDGTFYRPAGYDTPGTALSFDDPVAPAEGTSAIYRVYSVDPELNISDAAQTGYVYAKPTPIADLNVTGKADESANEMFFTPSVSLAGLVGYNIYALEQGTPLTDVSSATLLETVTPTVSSGNIAPTATASASHTYSTFYASNANDGNSTTRWDGQANVGPNWLMLDFGSDLYIGGASFSFYNSNSYRPKDYLIQTDDGAGGWVTQVNVTGNVSNVPAYTFASPVKTSRVRIYITSTYNTAMTYRPIIYEFSVYGKERYLHGLSNTQLKAEPGRTYSYAVIAEDVNSLVSDISGGPATVCTVPDSDAPDKVTDLTLDSAVGSTEVVVSWSTPLDNLGFGTGTGATQYEVYRLPTSSTGTPEPVTDDNFSGASLVHSGAYASSVAGTMNNITTTWYDHLGLYLAVRSSDAAGNWSVMSNSPNIVVGKDVEAPSPPLITACVPSGTPDMDVYWDPATDNVGINGYKLYRADVSVEPFASDECITVNNVGLADEAVPLIPYDADSVTDTGGTPGTTYYYGMVAWDDEGNVSSLSNCIAATVRTAATDTTVPTWGPTPLTAIQQPYPDIDLIWDAATDLDDSAGAGSIDHYDVYRNTTGFSAKTDPGVQKIATLSGVRNSYVDDTGNHDTKYWYAIVAVDASANANESVISNVATATVAPAPTPDNTPPSIPAGLAAATGVYPYMNLTWTASTDTDDAANPKQLNYYKLYRSDYPLDITEANKDNPTQVKTIIMANDAVSYTATGAGSGVYNFRLEAVDTAGNLSGMSTQVVGTVADAPCTDTTAPSAPTGFAAVIGPSPDMDLSWTASTDGGACSGAIDHYRLYRSESEITPATDLRTITPTYVAGNNTTYIDSSGTPNTQYWYVLTAVDTSGNESGMSDILVKTTAVDNLAPATIADLLATPDSGFMKLTWCRPSDNVGVDHYEIYRKQQAVILTDADIIPANKITDFVNSGVCLSFNDTGVSAATTYSYAVIAVDAAGNRSTISRGESTGDTVGTMP